MQQVASEATRPYNRPQPPAPNRPQQAATPASTPFSQMLDDAQAESDPQNQPAATDNGASLAAEANAEPAQATASELGKDGKQPVRTGFAKAASKDTSAPADKTATKTNSKIAKASTGLVSQSKDDTSSGAKTTDATPDPTLAQAIPQQAQVKTADATAAVVPVVAPPLAPIADTNAAVAPDALAALQSGADKTAAALAGKTAVTANGTGKPQSAGTGDADTTHAHAADGDADQPSVAAPNFAALAADASAPKTSADLAVPQTLAAPAQANPTIAANQTAAAQQAAPAVAIPLSGVAVEITNQAMSGKNQFDIRLDPPELGRIEVRLNVDHNGNVSARMIADRPDTLDLLRRDATGLQNALQDAGLKTSDNGLQFSLRDQSAYQQQQQNQQQQTPNGGNTAQVVVTDDTLPATDATQRSYGRLAGLGGGLDIQV